MTRTSNDAPTIDVYHDRVVICGQTVWRTEAHSPSQWYDFWEKVVERLRIRY